MRKIIFGILKSAFPKRKMKDGLMKIICRLIALLLVTGCFANRAYCDVTGYREVEIKGNEREKSLEWLQIKKIDEEMLTSGIGSFDINDKGYVLVLMNNETINIYDDKGKYLYGYAFHGAGGEMAGSTCLCYWIGDKIALYIYRGEEKIVIDGDAVTLYAVEGARFPLDYTDRGLVQNYDGYTYTLENSIGKEYTNDLDVINVAKDGKFVKKLIDVSQTKNLVGKEYVKRKEDDEFGYWFFVFVAIGLICVFCEVLHGKKSKTYS